MLMRPTAHLQVQFEQYKGFDGHIDKPPSRFTPNTNDQPGNLIRLGLALNARKGKVEGGRGMMAIYQSDGRRKFIEKKKKLEILMGLLGDRMTGPGWDELFEYRNPLVDPNEETEADEGERRGRCSRQHS